MLIQLKHVKILKKKLQDEIAAVYIKLYSIQDQLSDLEGELLRLTTFKSFNDQNLNDLAVYKENIDKEIEQLNQIKKEQIDAVAKSLQGAQDDINKKEKQFSEDAEKNFVIFKVNQMLKILNARKK